MIAEFVSQFQRQDKNRSILYTQLICFKMKPINLQNPLFRLLIRQFLLPYKENPDEKQPPSHFPVLDAKRMAFRNLFPFYKPQSMNVDNIS